MSYSIYRLPMATVNYFEPRNEAYILSGRVEVYAYLAVSGSQAVLIDSGVGTGNPYIEETFEPNRSDLTAELAKFDIRPTDIKLLVNSHLHFDHCGNNQLFSNAEIFVQASELVVARTTRYTPRKWFDYSGARLNPVEGDLNLSEGIKLVASPGHSPGHQSVLVDTRSGTALIAAQAAYTATEFESGGDILQAHEGYEQQYLKTIIALRSLAPEMVYFSHDEQVARLI